MNLIHGSIPMLFCLLALLPAVSTGAEPKRAAAEDQENWPAEITVTVGDIRTRIDGPKMWTMSGIDFQNNVMAVEDSAYGTVLTIRDVGHLGTAHFLDVPGKPGEVEKEIITSLEFFLDGKPIKRFQPKMNVSGKSFKMVRKSTIRSLELESILDVRDGVVSETSNWNVTGPIDLQKGHPLMYAFTPKNKMYVLGNENGIQKRAEYQKEGGTDVKTEKESTWIGTFDPVGGKGSVCYVIKQPAQPEAAAWFLLIDAPGIYRKMALYTFVDKIAQPGFKGTYQTAIGFFNATEADWEQQAQKRAEELKSFTSELSKP